MKKVITIVLALVMVFAIAAPAMAMTDAPLGTAGSASDLYDVSIKLAGGLPGYGTSLMVPEVAANKAYVANEAVYYVVNITAKAALDKANADVKAATNLVISGNGVSVASHTPTVYAYAGGMWAPEVKSPVANAAKNTLTWIAGVDFLQAGTGATAANKQYAIAGMGMVTGAVAEPSITVTVKMASMLEGTPYGALAMSDTTPVEIVKIAAGTYAVKTPTYYVTFIMNTTTNKCIRISIYDVANNKDYDVTYGQYFDTASGSYVNDYLFDDLAAAGKLPNAALKAAFLKVMNYMGFDYSKINTNAVLEAHFIAKLAAANVAATVAVPLYSAPVVVPQPDQIVPPKTGDAASTLGFVMIAAAIVAAAALAYKKVRA